jgi:cyclophilin family peptidyl-prolyl cis-trans isomerase
MMRKNAISRGNGSGVGSQRSGSQRSLMNNGPIYSEDNNASASNMSYSHIMAPSLSPRKVRQITKSDRKDSDADIHVDFSERSDESIEIQSCFDMCKENDSNNGNSYNHLNQSASNMRGGGRNKQRGQNLSLPSAGAAHYECPPKSYKELSPLWIIVMVAIGAITCCAGAFFFFEKYEDQHDAAIRLQMRMEEIGPFSKEMQGKLSAIETENAELKTKLGQEEEEIGALRKRTIKELPTLQEKVDRLEGAKNKMRNSIQNMSKQNLLEKFGPGPHRVEVQLAFDPDSKLEGTADRIVLEMAPVDELPHTVYWFLEQVDRKLYDKCSFHRNARHVIQAGPVGNFLTAPNEGLLKRFKESGFDSVLFQEYSSEYRHYKYTLGLAGRPGGPDFYINMQDNSRLHGPGGQSGNDPDDADPCFARVVEGFDAVARMHQSDIDEDGGYRHMRHNVAIQYMRILPPDYIPAAPNVA